MTTGHANLRHKYLAILSAKLFGKHILSVMWSILERGVLHCCQISNPHKNALANTMHFVRLQLCIEDETAFLMMVLQSGKFDDMENCTDGYTLWRCQGWSNIESKVVQ